MTGFRTDFTSSVWNFCRWVADFPPRETSPAAKSEGTRLFFQAIIADIVVQFYPWFNLILFCFKLIHTAHLIHVSPRQKQPPFIVRCYGRQFYSEIRRPFNLFCSWQQIGTFPMENVIVWARPRRRHFMCKNNRKAGIIWKPTGRITRFAQ